MFIGRQSVRILDLNIFRVSHCFVLIFGSIVVGKLEWTIVILATHSFFSSFLWTMRFFLNSYKLIFNSCCTFSSCQFQFLHFYWFQLNCWTEVYNLKIELTKLKFKKGPQWHLGFRIKGQQLFTKLICDCLQIVQWTIPTKCQIKNIYTSFEKEATKNTHRGRGRECVAHNVSKSSINTKIVLKISDNFILTNVDKS